MSDRRVFVLSDKKRKLRFPPGYIIHHVVSGDETTEMSLRRYLRDGGNFIKDDIFVSFLHLTPLEVRLQHPIIPINNLVITSKPSNIFDDIDNLEDREKDDYNIFSGDKLETDDEDVKEIVQKYMNELKNLTYAFIDAKYYPRSIPESEQGKVEDWMVTFEDPLQRLFVAVSKPEVSAPDLTVEDEFLINPDFRTGIVEYWMKVLANFIINNEITSVEEIGAIGKWSSLDVWNEIRDDIQIKLV